MSLGSIDEEIMPNLYKTKNENNFSFTVSMAEA
jgi:hypothetical protein